MWVAMIAAALVIGALVALLIAQRHRSRRLKEAYGTEYDHAVSSVGSRRRAEAELEERKQRVRQYTIRTLPREMQDRFAKEWLTVQARFVDKPVLAVAEADALVTEVMRARGYPMSDFEQQAADLSVDHPRVVEHYRAAHDLALESESGVASTEDLRQAMVHYRTLFEELVEVPVTTHADVQV